MANVTVIQDASMEMDTLKAELQHIFKELIGASLLKSRDGKNPTHYAGIFENLMTALEDFEKLTMDEEEPPYEEQAPNYPVNGFKVIESGSGEQNKNLKFIAEELLIKVEHLLQKVSEKEHLQRMPRDR